LDFEPARFVLHEHLLEKIACKNCQDGVVMARGPGKVIEGGIPGPGLLAEIIVNKYRDALPLYRQAQRFERHGLDIAKTTIGQKTAQFSRLSLLCALLSLLGLSLDLSILVFALSAKHIF